MPCLPWVTVLSQETFEKVYKLLGICATGKKQEEWGLGGS